MDCTSSNVDISRLDFAKSVLGNASVGLSMNLLVVILSPEGWQNQIAICQYLKI